MNMHNDMTLQHDPVKVLSDKPLVSGTASVRSSSLGKYTEVGENAKIVESFLGDYSYAMDRCNIIYSRIGKFVNIASDVRLNPGNHPLEWVSQHHFLYRRKMYGFADQDKSSFFGWRRMQKVTVGHDVWIGHKAIILPDVTIGNGAVVAAGAIVTKDVAPYTIVAGVPAKPLRSRFPESVWKCLEKIAWWDWDHDTLTERLDDFYDIRSFIQLYGS